MRRTAFILVAILAVLLPAASPVAAASCNGAAHVPSLTDGGATPAVGTTSTSVTFSVVYADTAGCAPGSITVTVSGVEHPLTGSDTTYLTGVTFSRSLLLPVGSHEYHFSATSGTGRAGAKTVSLSAVSPSSVKITAPPPPPSATPKPTPKPTPAPTASPVAPAPSTPAPVPWTPVPLPAVPSSGATEPPTTSPAPPSDIPSPSPAAQSATPAATPDESPTGVIAAAPQLHDSWRGTTGSGRGGAAGPDDTGAWAGLEGLPVPPAVLPVAIYLTSIGSILGAFAFLLWRRRRDAEPVAATVGPAPAEAVTLPPRPGATASSVQPPVKVTPLPPMRELIPPVEPDLLRDEPDERAEVRPEEVGVPRWLRPSVREARFEGSRDRYRRMDWNH